MNLQWVSICRFRGTLQLAEAARLVAEAPRKECLGVKLKAVVPPSDIRY